MILIDPSSHKMSFIIFYLDVPGHMVSPESSYGPDQREIGGNRLNRR